MAGLAKQVWEIAAADLGIRVVAPYEVILPSGSRILASVLVRDFGAAKGMLIVESFELVRTYHEEILTSGYGYSVLDCPKTEDAYDRESTMTMLRDWGWTGQDSSKPNWLSGRQKGTAR